MNLANRKWLAGIDYFQGPTCASCHMSAVPPRMDIKNADERITAALRSILSKDDEAVKALLPPSKPTKPHYGTTHDVGARLSWNLRQAISIKQEEGETKRQQMQAVCMQCHGDHFVQQFYHQFDSLVELYNNKFAVPATNMRSELIRDKKLSAKNYDEKIDLIYWKLSQKEGKRARYGAAMMGADYAWGQGLQEVVERYYLEFVPEVRKILGGKAGKFLRKHGYIEPVYKK
jgi:formate-dependent nitrite reductase cytochrome c552 subunit